MPEDKFAELRQQLMDQAREAQQAIIDRYRPKIEQARTDWDRANLHRYLQEEVHAIVRIYADALAKLPPPPVIIPASLVSELTQVPKA